MEDTQLLILGNGFDLQCGLKSTFNDFEEKRIAALNSMSMMVSRGKRIPYTDTPGPDGIPLSGNRSEDWFWEQKYTLWDLILKDEQQTGTWYDIEDCIKKWTNNIQSKMEQGGDGDNQATQGSSNPNSPRARLFWNQDIRLAIRAYANNMYRWNGSMERLLQILRFELQRYEESFAAYMKKQVQVKGDYFDAANELIRKLTFDQLALDTNYPTLFSQEDYVWGPGTNILDFNYTKPLKQSKCCPLVFNVHGRAEEGNIIFGIDGTGVDTDLWLYHEIVKFTKTFRLMALSSDPHPSLVQPYIAGTRQQGTRYIKFFGHSLGEADYSYFQAIFDEVDLYESQTRLIFYYNAKRRNNNEVAQNKADEEMFEKVNHLISRYGETLDNKDHGKNLLHKLLLEGRLSVIQAPL